MSSDYVEWDTDDSDIIEMNSEPQERYLRGRLYYPVCIGEVLANRYCILHKLGWGGFSTVWMVYDMQEKKDVALKILTSGRDGDREIFAQNEIIRRAHDRSNLVIYHSTFQLRGPNNDLHGVLVLPLIGPNLQSTLYKIPLSSHMHVRMSAARQLLLALKSLHDAGIVHSDLNEGAVMWQMKRLDQYNTTTKYEYLGRPQKLSLPDLRKPADLVEPMEVSQGLIEDRIYLGDFGMAIVAGTPVPSKIQTPAMFCAPERFHNVNPSFASDMWSYMCILTKLYIGYEPFLSQPGLHIISVLVNSLGPLPEHWKGYYCADCDPIGSEDSWYDQSKKPSFFSLASRLAAREPAVSQWEQDLVLSVLSKVFRYEPVDRLTAAELLADTDFNELMRIYGC